jgi:hypothetical protein
VPKRRENCEKRYDEATREQFTEGVRQVEPLVFDHEDGGPTTRNPATNAAAPFAVRFVSTSISEGPRRRRALQKSRQPGRLPTNPSRARDHGSEFGIAETKTAVQETAACFSNVGSAILSAHAGASERSATSPDDCIKQVVCEAVIEEGRRSRKPSPCHVFLPFSEPI